MIETYAKNSLSSFTDTVVLNALFPQKAALDNSPKTQEIQTVKRERTLFLKRFNTLSNSFSFRAQLGVNNGKNVNQCHST